MSTPLSPPTSGRAESALSLSSARHAETAIAPYKAASGRRGGVVSAHAPTFGTSSLAPRSPSRRSAGEGEDMLPTPPASLPASYERPLHRPLAPVAPSESEHPDSENPLIATALSSAASARTATGTTPPFQLDDGADWAGIAETMDLEGPPPVTGAHCPPTPPAGPFSTAPVHRPFRSRYASSAHSHDSLELPPPSPNPWTEEDRIGESIMPHKRSHSFVTPSTGSTPPASNDSGLFGAPLVDSGDDDEREESLPVPHWRRSFSYELQRAQPTVSTSVVSATAPARSGASTPSLSIFRRRTRAPTDPEVQQAATVTAPSSSLRAPDSDRASSKRRRSGTLSVEPPTLLPPWHNASGSTTSSVFPVLSRQATTAASTATAMSTSTDEDVRTIRRRARLSLSFFPSSSASASATGEDFAHESGIRRRTSLAAASLNTAEPAPSSSSSARLPPALLRPRSPIAHSSLAAPLDGPFAFPSPAQPTPSSSTTPASLLALGPEYDDLFSHARRSRALANRGEGLLREAAGVLARAEEEVGRASRLVDERERERNAAAQAEQRAARPAIGIRLGEGWAPAAPETTTAAASASSPPVSPTSPSGRRRRSSFFGLSSPPLASPASPPSDGGAGVPLSPTGSSSASTRARQFLTQLRARRPRLSRNATAVSPPESGSSASGSASTSRMSLDIVPPSATTTSTLRSWTLPSPPLADGLAGSSFDEEAEQAVADRLNRRLLERRRVSANIDTATAAVAHPEPVTTLWGETAATTTADGGRNRRLRGPTERANERWRFGHGPAQASTATSTSTSVHLDVGLLEGLTTPAAPPPWRRVRGEDQDRVGESLPSGAARDEADEYFFRRENSPSPRRRGRETPAWLADGSSSSLLLDAAEEGIGAPGLPALVPVRGSNLGRPSIRLPRPDASRSSSRPRLAFEDDEEAAGPTMAAGRRGGAAWAAPPTLPLMLPSGSDGRRLIFPHPAAAAGGTAAGESTAAGLERPRSASPFGVFGPDHLFQADPALLYHGPSNRSDRIETARNAFLGSDRRPMPWDDPAPSRRTTSRFDPFGDLPLPSTTAANATAESSRPSPPRRSSLADALSHIGPRGHTSLDLNLRRRRQVGQATADVLDPSNSNAAPGPSRELAELDRLAASRVSETVEDRLAQHRQSRMERLAALRRERVLMRGLLSGAAGATTSSASATAAAATASTASPAQRADAAGIWASDEEAMIGSPSSPPRSPGWRTRRGLGDFLRGLSGGAFGRGALIGIWDDDFHSLWGRGDSAAADPRNYLDDDEFDTSYEALLRLSERLGDAKPKGVSPEKLASLRTFKYSKWPFPARTSPAPPAPIASTSAVTMDKGSPAFARKGLEKEERCPICLTDYDDDDEVMLGQCGHGFHAECLTAAFKDKAVCPVCRRDHTT
ncbi:uncharacterized protein JCM10292_005133 [Rhodotorula paludigena]|uniref:uncharacterized protein n=1 Tax=Rhodotorula paludigena TaxID=86838 RepID=UPI00316D4422